MSNSYKQAIQIIFDDIYDPVQVCRKLAMNHPALFVELTKHDDPVEQKVLEIAKGSLYRTEHIREIVRRFPQLINGTIENPPRIECIKQFRDLTGCVLKEALDEVTRIRDMYKVS